VGGEAHEAIQQVAATRRSGREALEGTESRSGLLSNGCTDHCSDKQTRIGKAPISIQLFLVIPERYSDRNFSF
jgi:hypothetical protein